MNMWALIAILVPIYFLLFSFFSSTFVIYATRCLVVLNTPRVRI